MSKPSKPAGAPEAEIEITPEMIEAGVQAFRDWESLHDYHGGVAALELAVVDLVNLLLGIVNKPSPAVRREKVSKVGR